MKLLETSYLVDYEKGRKVAREYFETHAEEPLAASTISMFELAFGVVWESERKLERLESSLRWVDFLEFSVADAIETARIQAELQSTGERLPIGDMMIAGVARNRGLTLVTADDHFRTVEGLTVEEYRT